MKGSTIFAGLILLFLVFLLLVSLSYSPELALLPWISISLATVFVVVQLVKEVLAEPIGEEKASNTLKFGEWIARVRGIDRCYPITLGWIVGFLISIFLLGFLVAIPIFAFLYLKLHGESWRLSIGLSVLAVGIIYCGFVMALKVSLYKGFLFSLLSS